MGGLIAPVLHQVNHGIHRLSDAHRGVVHEHPDFDALSDNTPHLKDKELSCVLCSFSLLGNISVTLISSLPDIDAIISDLAEQYQDIHGSSFPIRGPPAIC